MAEAKLLDTVALNHADYEKVEQCVEAFYNNPHIKLLLEHKKRVCEASVFVQHENLCLKARPDLYIKSKGIIADIKPRKALIHMSLNSERWISSGTQSKQRSTGK